MVDKKSKADHKKTGYDIAKVDRQAGDNWVTMSNALVRASHGLSLPEKRVVMLAVSKLDSRKFHSKDNLPTVRFTAKEYSELFEIDMSESYKTLKAATDKLFDRTIVLRQPAKTRRKQGTKPDEITTRMNWIGEQTYHKGEGWIELTFWPRIVPHLTALKKHFTSYQLKQTATLRSMYSWRLLEMLTTYGKDKGDVTFEISDFHHAMEAPDSLKTSFGRLRVRIIEPAVKELREKDSWLIDWEPIKRGRKVQQIRFRYARNPQGSLF